MGYRPSPDEGPPGSVALDFLEVLTLCCPVRRHEVVPDPSRFDSARTARDAKKSGP